MAGPFLPSTSELTSHYHPEASLDAQEIVQHLDTVALSISSIYPFKIFFRAFGTIWNYFVYSNDCLSTNKCQALRYSIE